MSRPAKIAACYCIYNEEEFIEYSIRSIYEAVDRIVICLGMAPWSAYNSEARRKHAQRDRTEDIVDRLAASDPKFVVKKGVWESEVAQRQTAMECCVNEGIDYYFLIDGDEVYRPDHLRVIREEVEAHPDVGTFHIKCTVLWHSFRYRIPYWGVKWTPWRLFKITRSRKLLGLSVPYRCRITGPNRTNSLGPRYLIPPHKAIFYHLGYARATERMRLKFDTSEQQRHFVNGWFEDVWMKWPQQRSMKNLQPLDPEGLPEALPVDPSDLPELLRAHPYWNLEIIP
ncbi:MAG: hypothetical protein COV75_03375 [Candidatus Omnitrophica bacterium CG11_big_fil_rev_8_21_14_0_20_63_9]|nr:MAG: hypothetical protein COV75_03375 [Candidatus Omnitrophica bacterium CG11_big_fil_rev_8_21_14_0_20_63_9]